MANKPVRVMTLIKTTILSSDGLLMDSRKIVSKTNAVMAKPNHFQLTLFLIDRMLNKIESSAAKAPKLGMPMEAGLMSINSTLVRNTTAQVIVMHSSEIKK